VGRKFSKILGLDHRGVNLISDALPFGRLWYGEPDAVSNAVDYAKHRSRSHDAVIRVYDEARNVIGVHAEAHSRQATLLESTFACAPLKSLNRVALP